MRSNFGRTLALALVCAAVPAVAQAQIYSWRDAGGNLVISNTPKDAAARTFEVPGVRGTIRTTRKVTDSKLLNKRAAQYESLIVEHATAQGVNPDLVRGVIQAESAFNPQARSHKGAMGLMQLMPATALLYGVTNPYDPAQNIRAGVAYLKSLLTKYAQKEELALAAYNAGPGAVKKYGAVPPYRETRDYIARIQRTTGTGSQRPRAATTVYSVVEVVDGREITRLSNVPPQKAAPLRTSGLN
jgi:soluble lytic murein transglycosylase-like protein